MPASFDGNDGNDGNSANSGGGGNATSSSGGWFFADRVDLPLVTTPDTGPNQPNPDVMIGALNTIAIRNFPNRNWSAEWYAWLSLNEFAGTTWAAINPATNAATVAAWNASISWIPGPPAPPPGLVPFFDWSTVQANADAEIQLLVTAAANERADALAEILSQSDEFISYFLNMMTARPGAYPYTTKVLAIASLVGTFVAMYFKAWYGRPRPSQLCPALLPPIEVPGHASFPSGHSTQAHLMALCMNQVLGGLPQQATMFDDLWTLADRIARNREIAGLHYPSDSLAGVLIARLIEPLLATTQRYSYAVTQAAGEWQ
jgi:membrane-associated phospholipid phosphatase